MQSLEASLILEKRLTLFEGDCRDLLARLPDECLQLVVTSPPYNIGKEYEKKRSIERYVAEQVEIIKECVRCLKRGGSICWQVGNFVEKGSIIPIDCLLAGEFLKLGLKMRNRIIWHFEHGLHCKNRFSGRYEVILWFTKGKSHYFDLDPVRVPQKYPGKRYFKGPKAGQLSCNPAGKNPGDVWTIPNVKHNHVEKTSHPCQFPVELIERLVLSMSEPDDIVMDPFMGVGSTAIAALKNGRRAIGAEISKEYHDLSLQRVKALDSGDLKTRPMGQPVYTPPKSLARELKTSTPLFQKKGAS